MTPSPLAVLACAALAACGGPNGSTTSAATPSGGEPLQLTVQAPSATLATGDSMTIRFELRNAGRDTLRLTFPSGCTVMPYVTGPDTLDVRYPGGGGWMCTMALTELALAPGGVETREVRVVAGGEAGGDRAVLAPGAYLVFARLEHPERPLRSALQPLTVR